MVDSREAALTFARIRELHRDPVQGRFDIAHLREVHRRIFQDLPDHRPGEFRPEASGHFKHRLLEATRERTVVPYALRSDTDRQLGATLEALQGGRALAGFDLLEMSEAIAQTYARLDYLHPFRDGNSRTLRSFTEQLARENGHRLDWNTTNVTPEARDALYIARDTAVIQLRHPGLTAESMMTVEDRHEYELAFQLNSYRLHDPLQELVRRSLERGRDTEPFDRLMSVGETVREIAAIGPVALNQAERSVDASRLAVLRHKAPVSDHEAASDLRERVTREGTMAALTDRLELVASGHITIHHEPGAPALDRLVAIADGIRRELAQQRSVSPAPQLIGRDDPQR